jgi:hypothetical protein
MGMREHSSRKNGPSGLSWPSFLRGEHATHIADRLAEGDPLRVRERSARRLREVWFLLEPDRLFLRAIAVCAEGAMVEDPPKDMEAWVLAKIDLAIEQLVRRDRTAEEAHPELLEDEEKVFPLLTHSFLLEPDTVRRVTVGFNRLDPLPRRAFYELIIEARDVPSVIESGPWNEDGLYDAIQTALTPLGLDMASGETKGKKRRKKK